MLEFQTGLEIMPQIPILRIPASADSTIRWTVRVAAGQDVANRLAFMDEF
jgi:hypothetical protein